MDGDVKIRALRKCGFLSPLAATFLVAVMIAACGTAAAPVAEESRSHPAGRVQENEDAVTSGAAISAAGVAPAFQLPTASGETLSLASFAGDKNVVLVFYRGFW